MASASTASYASCVSSLRTSLTYLESSVDTLGAGVSDFPRLINVLKTVRHYELIPQPTLAAAESSLRDEIGPAIALLLSRADASIERQDRRIETLKARAELQHGRLSRPEDDDGSASKRDKELERKRSAARARRLSAGEQLRAKMVRQRKEQARYGVERLELEVLQKERELRKRLEG